MYYHYEWVSYGRKEVGNGTMTKKELFTLSDRVFFEEGNSPGCYESTEQGRYHRTAGWDMKDGMRIRERGACVRVQVK